MFGTKKVVAPPSLPMLVSGNLQVLGSQAWVIFLAFLCAFHFLCYWVARDCKGTKLDALSSDPMLAAHILPQILAFAIAVYLGAGDWLLHMDDVVNSSITQHVPQGERIACLMVGFQMYELLACAASQVRATTP